MAKDKNIFKENMTFDYTELTALCEHLKIREREGKRLKKIDKYSLIYDKCESRDIRYSAVIFSNSLMHSDFVASCEQEGWEYVTSRNELYIFRTQSPDAGEIMTDEKEYFRIVTQNFLKHPSFFGITGFSVYVLLRHFFNMLTDNSTLASEGYIIMNFLFWVGFTISVIYKLSDFIDWYKKAKNAVRNNKKIPFVNYNERKNKKLSRIIGHCITATAFFCLWFYIVWGYIPTNWLLYTNLTIIGICISIALYDCFKITSKKKALLACVMSILVYITGAYFLSVNINTAYNENPNVFKEASIPVTVADLTGNECLCENEIRYYSGTKFAQYYDIVSHCTIHDEKIYYEIFVSNNENIKRNFIKKLETKEKGDLTSYNPENSVWDEQYRTTFEDKISSYGFAVKDDTVVYFNFYTIDNDVGKDIGFFDTAYEKLFG